MAEYNIKINVKTDSGYDTLYPETKSDLVKFNNSGSNITATNTEQALKELDTTLQNVKKNSDEITKRIDATISNKEGLAEVSEVGYFADAKAIKDYAIKKLELGDIIDSLGTIHFGGGDRRVLKTCLRRYKNGEYNLNTNGSITLPADIHAIAYFGFLVQSSGNNCYSLPYQITNNSGEVISRTYVNRYESNKTFTYTNNCTDPRYLSNWSGYDLYILTIGY